MHGQGYEALYELIRYQHPLFVSYPSTLVANRPSQRNHQSIREYFNDYMDFMHLRAYIDDDGRTLNLDSELETFISRMKNGDLYLEKTYDERHSNNPHVQHKYTQEQIVATLEEFTPRVKVLISRSTHVAASPVQPKALTYRNQGASKPMQKKKKLHFVDAAALDNVPALEIPDQFDIPVFQLAVDNYVNAVGAIHRNPESAFDVSKPCAMCTKSGHTFEHCPLLNDIQFLKQHFIKYKLNASRLIRDCDNYTSDSPSKAVQQVALASNDNPQHEDFHQGQE